MWAGCSLGNQIFSRANHHASENGLWLFFLVDAAALSLSRTLIDERLLKRLLAMTQKQGMGECVKMLLFPRNSSASHHNSPPTPSVCPSSSTLMSAEYNKVEYDVAGRSSQNGERSQRSKKSSADGRCRIRSVRLERKSWVSEATRRGEKHVIDSQDVIYSSHSVY